MKFLRYEQRGLTLLEALVTLVIVAMVAGLMSEGLYQLGRIEQRLGTGQLQAQLERLHLLWIQQALEGLQAVEAEAPDHFQGSARRLRGSSGMLPTPRSEGPMPMRLALDYRADRDVTELSLDADFGGSTSNKPVVLARWSGDSGRFDYLDAQGEWHQDWPPSGPQAQLLPRAVAILRQNEDLLLLGVPQVSAQPLGKRVDLSKLP